MPDAFQEMLPFLLIYFFHQILISEFDAGNHSLDMLKVFILSELASLFLLFFNAIYFIFAFFLSDLDLLQLLNQFPVQFLLISEFAQDTFVLIFGDSLDNRRSD